MRTAILDFTILFFAVLLATLFVEIIAQNISLVMGKSKKFPSIMRSEDYIPPSQEQQEQEDNEMAEKLSAVMIKTYKKMKEDPEVE